MHLSSLVEMVDSGFAERVLLGDRDCPVTGARLARLASAGASTLAGRRHLVYIGENHPLLPVALFSAAWAGIPFVPLNYRLDEDNLNDLIGRLPDALVLADAATAPRLRAKDVTVLDEWLESIPARAVTDDPAVDDDAVAVILFTSGTTSEPKSALLRHRHLMAYLLGSVEFGGAAEDEAMLVAVPPYHVAGLANMLSSTFAGRRLVYLRSFDANRWLEVVRSDAVTNAMVVPTMLARIVDALDGRPANVPTLRTLSYGGAKISDRVLTEALRLFPATGFVNAYGLTETASTIAVLSPEDHRAAVESHDPVLRGRLSSAGKVLPTVEVAIRDELGAPRPVGAVGLIHVRGEQVSGEYGSGSALDTGGWFFTRDLGRLDADGYLFVEGRADDTIIRGGENIAPAEIEDRLLAHPDVLEACVVGVPNDEWGQLIVAAVVPRDGSTVTADELRQWVRAELRGSKTPERIVFRTELPHTETGKLLRRFVQRELSKSD